MAKKQTRRSISVSESMYQRIRAHSAHVKMPMSQIVEAWVDILPPVDQLPPVVLR